jgi:uncharacterized RDD family membrane protein YckC
MSELPSYPREAAEREEAAGPPGEPPTNYASWLQRVGAALIDGLILTVPVVAIVAIALVAGNPDDEDDASWGVVAITYLLSLVAPFLYYTIFHGRPSGQTLGKRAVRIRVVGDNGAPIGYARAFGRYAITVVFAFACFIPLLLDYLWPLWDKKKQSWHDKIVSSVVVRA